MSDSPRVLIDLVVITALVRFVAEEVDGLEVDAVRQVLVGFDVL